MLRTYMFCVKLMHFCAEMREKSIEWIDVFDLVYQQFRKIVYKLLVMYVDIKKQVYSTNYIIDNTKKNDLLLTSQS